MERGTVIWFDVGRGYGYIRRDGGLPDLLVTLSAVERAGMASLTRGQRLSFEDAYSDRIKRECAENISRVLDPSVDGY
jgi:CspA family cold shock protein